jgi:CRISPR/Cas system CMR-associated protein Cmr1 (group 7 of RAMP superfamily)
MKFILPKIHGFFLYWFDIMYELIEIVIKIVKYFENTIFKSLEMYSRLI